MSETLQERLRDRRVCSIAQNACYNDARMDEAADALDTLTAERDEARGMLDLARMAECKAIRERDEARAEVERLRATVDRIHAAVSDWEAGDQEPIDSMDIVQAAVIDFFVARRGACRGSRAGVIPAGLEAHEAQRYTLPQAGIAGARLIRMSSPVRRAERWWRVRPIRPRSPAAARIAMEYGLGFPGRS